MVASGGFFATGVAGSVLNTIATPNNDQTGWITFKQGIALAGHCMSQIDSMTLVLTGGYLSSNGPFSQRTYFFSWYNKKLTQGPDLTASRAEHGCSFITGMDGNPTAIVAGGRVSSNTFTSTVEIFNRALNKWESGPALPKPMSLFKVLIFYRMRIKIPEK